MPTDEEGEVVSIEVIAQVETAAECADILLRETKTTRMFFRAKLVDSATVGAGVRGRLVFQKKSRTQDWDDYTTIKLSSLKAGEAVSIELRSAEVLGLRQWLTELQIIKNEYGVPPQDTRFIGIRRNPFANLFGGNPVEVLVPKDSNSEHLVEALKAVLARDDLRFRPQR